MSHFDDVKDIPITRDDQVLEMVQSTVGRAIRRQNWLTFLDAENRMLPSFMPMDDHPLVPIDDDATAFATAIGALMEAVGASQVILTWERPGRPEPTAVDTKWAQAMAESCRDKGVRLRGQLLSHTHGVSWLAPDESVERAAGTRMDP